eukprot:scaffold87773_cov60-Phaeocystis_antarctica.AAC.3
MALSHVRVPAGPPAGARAAFDLEVRQTRREDRGGNRRLYSKHVTALVKHVTARGLRVLLPLRTHRFFRPFGRSEMFHPDWQERRGLNERRGGVNGPDRVRTGHGRYRSSSGRRTWYMVQGKQRSANVQAPSSAVQQACRGAPARRQLGVLSKRNVPRA